MSPVRVLYTFSREGGGVAGVHVAEAQRDEPVGPVIVGDAAVIAADGVGHAGPVGELGADQDGVHVRPQIVAAEHGIAAVKAAGHQAHIALGVGGLTQILPGQLHAVARPSCR